MSAPRFHSLRPSLTPHDTARVRSRALTAGRTAICARDEAFRSAAEERCALALGLLSSAERVEILAELLRYAGALARPADRPPPPPTPNGCPCCAGPRGND